MTSIQYIGMDVHKESISIAVMNAAGKIVMECVIECRAKKGSAPSRRRDMSLDIPFYRTCPNLTDSQRTSQSSSACPQTEDC
jgi:hypothetical protein